MVEQVWLFSYGTLRQANVQRALFGRELESVADALVGFTLDTVVITDPGVIATSGSDRHPILKPGDDDDMVAGSALRLTNADLDAADRYETADYVRIGVTLASGRTAYAYVRAQA